MIGNEPRMRMDDPGAAHLGAPPLSLGRDRDLVAACLALGGFPRAVRLADGRTVWASHDDRPWRFGAAKPTIRRGRPAKGAPA